MGILEKSVDLGLTNCVSGSIFLSGQDMAEAKEGMMFGKGDRDRLRGMRDDVSMVLSLVRGLSARSDADARVAFGGAYDVLANPVTYSSSITTISHIDRAVAVDLELNAVRIEFGGLAVGELTIAERHIDDTAAMMVTKAALAKRSK